jgi:hypothetical protein
MKKVLISLLCVNALLLLGRFWQELPADAAVGGGGVVAGSTGDVDGDGEINITDAVRLLGWLFQGGPPPVACAQMDGFSPAEIRTLKDLLAHLQVLDIDTGRGTMARTVRLSGVNLQLVNGLGATNGLPDADPNDWESIINGRVNGSGNLIVGYQELRDHPNFSGNDRTGSHNIVVGTANDYASYGGLVVGRFSSIAGAYSSVTGGSQNAAIGPFSSVSGGYLNQAVGIESSVGGGVQNTASGVESKVCGGRHNDAAGRLSTVSGGGHDELRLGNVAGGTWSSISGGAGNRTAGDSSSICGGSQNLSWGPFTSIAGGLSNRADGEHSTVLGGENITLENVRRCATGVLEIHGGP